MSEKIQREVMEYDVVIVGAGPAGLATAIKLRQLQPDVNVCILEKASEPIINATFASSSSSRTSLTVSIAYEGPFLRFSLSSTNVLSIH